MSNVNSMAKPASAGKLIDFLRQHFVRALAAGVITVLIGSSIYSAIEVRNREADDLKALPQKVFALRGDSIFTPRSAMATTAKDAAAPHLEGTTCTLLQGAELKVVGQERGVSSSLWLVDVVRINGPSNQNVSYEPRACTVGGQVLIRSDVLMYSLAAAAETRRVRAVRDGIQKEAGK